MAMTIIIDGNAVCYRYVFNLKGLSYTEKEVGIIFGFVREILKLAVKFDTNRFIFCWDSKNSYRKLRYESYKAKRRENLTTEEKADLAVSFRQFDDIREKVLPYMGFKNIFRQNGYEADDLIAWFVYREPNDYVIVSSDNDLLQLLSDDQFNPVKIYNLKTKSITTAAIFSKTWEGLKPSDWIMVKSIAGCTSDNIEGLPGIGEISATRYILKTLRGANKISLIDSSKDIINRNHALVALPYKNGLKPIKIGELEEDKLDFVNFCAILGQYGFKSLLKEEEIAKWGKILFPKRQKGTTDGKRGLF